MTKEKVAPKLEEVKALFTENPDAFRSLLQKVCNAPRLSRAALRRSHQKMKIFIF